MRGPFREWLRRAGVTAGRWPPHRFDAMDASLHLLKAQGFAPRAVVDIGANTGAWTALASRIFADAPEFHLVEPLPACAAELRRFRPPRFTLHRCALTRRGVASARMIGAGSGMGTGAGIADAAGADSSGIDVPATTLDDLLGGKWTADANALLKLDVESHELAILADGGHVLDVSEVVITEFQAYQFDGVPAPILADVIHFMQARGYLLYDIAALASRPRDGRLRGGDAVFVKASSPLARDARWA